MNFSIQPHQLVAHWVPGLILLVFIRVVGQNFEGVVKIPLPSGEAARLFTYSVLAFALGQLLDAIRNLVEHILDRWDKVNWDFFFEGPQEKIERLDRHYFTYYVFDANLTIACTCFMFAELLLRDWVWFAVPLLPTYFFARDGGSLRKEIAKHTRSFQVKDKEA